jgi:cytosine/adenosine deaminase-related metal-dependent hydrolase
MAPGLDVSSRVCEQNSRLCGCAAGPDVRHLDGPESHFSRRRGDWTRPAGHPDGSVKAITINPAYQYGEHSSKGSIEPGKLADMVILSGNPLTVPVGSIKDIKVVETFKEGKSIYQSQ